MTVKEFQVQMTTEGAKAVLEGLEKGAGQSGFFGVQKKAKKG